MKALTCSCALSLNVLLEAASPANCHQSLPKKEGGLMKMKSKSFWQTSPRKTLKPLLVLEFAFHLWFLCTVDERVKQRGLYLGFKAKLHLSPHFTSPGHPTPTTRDGVKEHKTQAPEKAMMDKNGHSKAPGYEWILGEWSYVRFADKFDKVLHTFDPNTQCKV